MRKKGIRMYRLIASTLAASGAFSLFFSSWLESSFLAILSITLFFWSVITYYIYPQKCVPLKILTATYLPHVINLEKFLLEQNIASKGFYLGPKTLRTINLNIVFIPKNPQQEIPAIKNEIVENFPLMKSEGIFLFPLGGQLMGLFEEEFGTSFSKLDIAALPDFFQKILVDKLELAEKIEINIQMPNITLTVEGSVFEELCQETLKYPLVHASVGCLFSSSIACILTRVTGRTVKILNENKQTQKISQMQFQLLDE